MEFPPFGMASPPGVALNTIGAIPIPGYFVAVLVSPYRRNELRSSAMFGITRQFFLQWILSRAHYLSAQSSAK
jgi:hypothetical protein